MRKIKFLLVGESWMSNSTHYKGWDFFSSSVYETGIEYLKPQFDNSDIEFIHMPSHIAAQEFPLSIESLNEYNVIFLSDIGSNTLLLHPETWIKGKSVNNRLQLIADWVQQGGGLCMCGGYYSFAGIYGGAKYYRTPIEDILPVNIFTFDDRIEIPEGASPKIINSNHPIVKNLEGEWPPLLGINELTLKPNANLIASIKDFPLLSSLEMGKGRTLIWSSDIGPHWCSAEFLKWHGYGILWKNAVYWLARKI